MIFWASSEATADAANILRPIRSTVEGELNRLFSENVFDDFDVRIRYIPIVMSAVFRASYPARSRTELKNRIHNCCPQLDYDAFMAGPDSARIAIYLDGLQDCSKGLKKLGATAQQIAAFEKIVQDTKTNLMAEADSHP